MAIFRKARDLRRMRGLDQATRRALLGFVVPVWLVSGFADWSQHRRTNIERTAGTKESILHLMMLAEAGVPSMLGLFLEINAGVLLTSYAALLAHEFTALWDINFADGRRRVLPLEQHVHSFLEVGPIMAVTLLTVLYWTRPNHSSGSVPTDRTLAFGANRIRLAAATSPCCWRPSARSASVPTPKNCGGAGAPSTPIHRASTAPGFRPGRASAPGRPAAR